MGFCNSQVLLFRDMSQVESCDRCELCYLKRPCELCQYGLPNESFTCHIFGGQELWAGKDSLPTSKRHRK